MILSKIAESRPESIRWPSASIVSLADMRIHSTECVQFLRRVVGSTAVARRRADRLGGTYPHGQRRRTGTIFEVAPQADDEVVDGPRVGALVQAPRRSRIAARETACPAFFTR